MGKEVAENALKQKVLQHKGRIYVYGLHNKKLERLSQNGFSKLKEYLYNVLAECPDSYFNNCKLRGSQLKLRMNFGVKEAGEHEVNMLTKYGLIVNSERYKDNHSKVQMFMLEYDKKTVAMEIPIWVSKDELEDHKEMFTSDDLITGHIDLVRIEDDKIWIWDYKPNANKELYAATQIYFYALMLSKRTGIELGNFMCGYFDSNSTYVFDPNKKARSLLQEF